MEADTVAEDVRFDMTEGGQKKRWSMIFALFVAFVLCNLDKVNMSVAIVPMSASFGWTSVEKGLVQSAFFWGYAFTQIPGGWLAQKYGGKLVLFAGVMLWSFGTLIAPVCARSPSPRCSRRASSLASARASPPPPPLVFSPRACPARSALRR